MDHFHHPSTEGSDRLFHIGIANIARVNVYSRLYTNARLDCRPFSPVRGFGPSSSTATSSTLGSDHTGQKGLEFIRETSYTLWSLLCLCFKIHSARYSMGSLGLLAETSARPSAKQPPTVRFKYSASITVRLLRDHGNRQTVSRFKVQRRMRTKTPLEIALYSLKVYT